MRTEHHLFIHFSGTDVGAALVRIEAALAALNVKETQQMALGEDILAKIAAQKTIIDGIVRTQRSRNTPPATRVPEIVGH